MNRKMLRWIIGLMNFALIGLIVFQLYWIDTVIRANDERFERDVVEALQAVSEKLEKQEIYSVFHRRFLAPRVQPIGSNPVNFPKGQNQGLQSVFFELSDTANSGSLDFTFSFNFRPNGQIEFLEEVKVDEPKKVLESVTEIPDDKKKLYLIEDVRGNDLPTPSQNNYWKSLERISNKSNAVVTVLQDVLVANPALPNRFDQRQLDSLLKYELKDRGISIDYNYAVVSSNQKQFVHLKGPMEAKEALENSELKASLFSNDLNGISGFLVVDFPGKSQFLLGKIWTTMGSSGILILTIMFCFGYAVRTIVKQKRLSEMKNDFINNMTHELKTPIATVGLATEALQDNDIKNEELLRSRYLGVISEENKRLGHHVEKVLQMAAIEKGDLKLKLESLSFHDIVKAAVDKISIQVENRLGTIKTALNAVTDKVKGDETHLLNVVLNLLDNANKYSKETPDIVVRTELISNKFILSVQDHGIGMDREALKHIFEKFYRQPTGNVHDVKGFGLGLSYVQNVVDLHGGSIDVKSEPGKGSKFFISLPLQNA